MGFAEVLAGIERSGVEWHRETIIANSIANCQHIKQTTRDIAPDHKPCLIVSAGPSLYRQKILSRIHKRFNGTIVATDGAYIQCLKAGIVPDWVVTLDPHPTRMVRWFGDPAFEENAKGDDYFARQDLDVDFRSHSLVENEKNIQSVDAHKAKLVICSTAPANVVARTSAFERYWFAPLVDQPVEGSITRTITDATKLPALNTGGTVGTASWVFAHSVLRSALIAVVGMDFGYALDTPLQQTQSWHMLGGDPEMYPRKRGHWGVSYTDPTYAWYLQNFLGLLKANKARIVNCSGEGLLIGDGVGCMELEQWLKSSSSIP